MCIANQIYCQESYSELMSYVNELEDYLLAKQKEFTVYLHMADNELATSPEVTAFINHLADELARHEIKLEQLRMRNSLNIELPPVVDKFFTQKCTLEDYISPQMKEVGLWNNGAE